MAAEKRKVYVKVRTLTDLSGALMPEEIVWENGKHYPITRVSDVTALSGRRACFTVHLGEATRLLYLEHLPVPGTQCFFRWYMEVEDGGAA